MPQQGGGRAGRFRFTGGATLYRTRRAKADVTRWARRFPIIHAGQEPPLVVFDDQPSYTSTSTFTINESRIGDDRPVGTGTSTQTVAEAVVFTDAVAGTGTSAWSITETLAGTDEPVGVSSTSFTLAESWATGPSPPPPPPEQPLIPSGLVDLVTRRRPPPKLRPIVYRDRPVGVSTSTWSLVEQHERAPVARVVRAHTHTQTVEPDPDGLAIGLDLDLL